MGNVGTIFVRIQADISQFSSAMSKAERKVRDFKKVGAALTYGLTIPLVGVGIASIRAAASFEQAFTGIKKTVKASEADFAILNQQIREMAKRTPMAATELAKIGQLAGQLGVKAGDIARFVDIIAQISVSTNLSSEAAAIGFARIAGMTELPLSKLGNLASAVVALGNNFRVFEDYIVEMSERWAATGHMVGLTADQIVGLSGAMGHLGVQMEMGGSAMERMLIIMDKAAKEGGKNLNLLGTVANTTGKSFKDMWEQDASKALQAFISGLGEAMKSGQNIYPVLKALGLEDIRLRNVLIKLASGHKDLAKAMAMTSQEFSKNTALATEAGRFYGTTESKLKMFWNRLTDVRIEIGNALIPALLAFLDAIDPLINSIMALAQGFAQLDYGTRGVIVGILLFVALLGPAIYLVGLFKQAVLILASVWKIIAGAWAGPLGWVMAALGLLAMAWFALDNDTREAMKDFAAGIWSYFSEAWSYVQWFWDKITGFVSAIGNVLKSVKQSLIETFGAGGDFFKRAGEGGLLSGVIQGIQERGKQERKPKTGIKAATGAPSEQPYKLPGYLSKTPTLPNVKDTEKNLAQIKQKVKEWQAEILRIRGEGMAADLSEINAWREQALIQNKKYAKGVETINALTFAKKDEMIKNELSDSIQKYATLGGIAAEGMELQKKGYEADLLNVEIWRMQTIDAFQDSEDAMVLINAVAGIKRQEAIKKERAEQISKWAELGGIAEEGMRLQKRTYEADLLNVEMWRVQTIEKYQESENAMVLINAVAAEKRKETIRKEREEQIQKWTELAGIAEEGMRLQNRTYESDLLNIEAWRMQTVEKFQDSEDAINLINTVAGEKRKEAYWKEANERMQIMNSMSQLEIDTVRKSAELWQKKADMRVTASHTIQQIEQEEVNARRGNLQADLTDYRIWLDEKIQEYQKYGPNAMARLAIVANTKLAQIYQEDAANFAKAQDEKRERIEKVYIDVYNKQRLLGKKGIDRTIEEIHIEYEERRKNAKSMIEVEALYWAEKQDMMMSYYEEEQKMAEEAASRLTGAISSFFVAFASGEKDMSEAIEDLGKDMRRVLAETAFKPIEQMMNNMISQLYQIPFGVSNLGYALGMGALGWFMGGELAYATGGNQEMGGIGGLVGGLAGVAIGGPIGGLIGVAAGGFLGGMFGESTKEKEEKAKRDAEIKQKIAEARNAAKLVNKQTKELQKTMHFLGFDLGMKETFFGQPKELSAFGKTVRVSYEEYGKISEKGQEILEDFVQRTQQIAENLRSTMVNIIGGGLAKAFEFTDAKSGMKAFAANLKESVFNAILEGVTEALLNTRLVKEAMAPIFDLMAKTFTPEAQWGKEMEKNIRKMVNMTKALATNKALLGAVGAITQMRAELMTALGIGGAISPTGAGPAIKMQHGGQILENVWGIGASGQSYLFHAGERISPDSMGNQQSIVQVDISGAYLGDERTLNKFARKIQTLGRKQDEAR
jgi:TP901 family phage tail tape measure protein